MGVKDDLINGRNITGIAKEQIVDSSNYQQFILNNIEPDLDFNLHYIDYKNKQIAIIEISNSFDKPYMTKKQYKNLNQGLILIRKGSTNSLATRADIDRIYQEKTGQFEIKILDNHIRAIRPQDGTALIDVSLRNLTSNPITIVSGILHTKDTNNRVITSHPAYGFESEMGADFRLEIPPKKEFTGDLHIGFGSNDCLRLNLDQFGYTNESFIFDLKFEDSYGNKYQTSIKDGFIFARGDFLWKVALKYK